MGLGLLYCTMHHWVRYYLWVRVLYAGFASDIDHFHVLQSCVLYHTGFKYNLKEHLFLRVYFSNGHNTMMQKMKSSLWKPTIIIIKWYFGNRMLFQLVPGGFSYLINQNNENSYWKKLLGFKGQLISKCPLGVTTSSKKPTIFFPGFLP